MANYLYSYQILLLFCLHLGKIYVTKGFFGEFVYYAKKAT